MPGDGVQHIACSQQNSGKNKSYQNDVKTHDNGHSNMAWACRHRISAVSLSQAMATIYQTPGQALMRAYMVRSVARLLLNLKYDVPDSVASVSTHRLIPSPVLYFVARTAKT